MNVNFKILFSLFICLTLLISFSQANNGFDDKCYKKNKEVYQLIRDSLSKYIIEYKGFENKNNLNQIPIKVNNDNLYGFYIWDLKDTLNTSIKNKCVELIDNHVYLTSSYWSSYSMGIIFYWEKDTPKFFYIWNKDSLGKNRIDSIKLKDQWGFVEQKLGKEEMLSIKNRYYKPMYKIKYLH